MPIKTITFVLLLLKIYAAVAFAYFLILLFQVDKGLTAHGGVDLQNTLTQGLLWPKDLLNYLLGTRR